MAVRSAIDPDKLRAFLRKLPGEDLLRILDRAIDLLPPNRREGLIDGYVSPERLRPGPGGRPGLLATVHAFCEESLRGDYYEEFDVNSKNFMEKSRGTQIWIAECERLVDLCVTAARRGRHAEARDAFDRIFGLLRRVDRCDDNIVFFADEGGSWQVGVDWRDVLPVWLRCLAASTEPDDYAREAVRAIDDFARADTGLFLKSARAAASREQRVALARVAASTNRMVP